MAGTNDTVPFGTNRFIAQVHMSPSKEGSSATCETISASATRAPGGLSLPRQEKSVLGKTGKRTMFDITVRSLVSIKEFSGLSEDECILLRWSRHDPTQGESTVHCDDGLHSLRIENTLTLTHHEDNHFLFVKMILKHRS